MGDDAGITDYAALEPYVKTAQELFTGRTEREWLPWAGQVLMKELAEQVAKEEEESRTNAEEAQRESLREKADAARGARILKKVSELGAALLRGDITPAEFKIAKTKAATGEFPDGEDEKVNEDEKEAERGVVQRRGTEEKDDRDDEKDDGSKANDDVPQAVPPPRQRRVTRNAKGVTENVDAEELPPVPTQTTSGPKTSGTKRKADDTEDGVVMRDDQKVRNIHFHLHLVADK
jgi:hypothetical protein